MVQNDYLFVYERIDGSQFNVLNKFTSNELATESMKFSLSRHKDLKRCKLFVLQVVEEIENTSV